MRAPRKYPLCVDEKGSAFNPSEATSYFIVRRHITGDSGRADKELVYKDGLPIEVPLDCSPETLHNMLRDGRYSLVPVDSEGRQLTGTEHRTAIIQFGEPPFDRPAPAVAPVDKRDELINTMKEAIDGLAKSHVDLAGKIGTGAAAILSAAAGVLNPLSALEAAKGQLEAIQAGTVNGAVVAAAAAAAGGPAPPAPPSEESSALKAFVEQMAPVLQSLGFFGVEYLKSGVTARLEGATAKAIATAGGADAAAESVAAASAAEAGGTP